MSLEAIIRGKTPSPRRLVVYGTKGIGKSTFANAAPNPFFINIENGLDNIDVFAKTGWLQTYADVVYWIAWLATNEHEFKTVVIDSADWLESVIFKLVAHDEGKEHIQQIGYAKGFLTAAEKFSYLFRGLEMLRQQKKMHVIFLAHDQIVKFNDPNGDAYDRYAPALHKETYAVLTEWCDDVLFATYKTYTKTEDQGFGKKRSIGIDGKQRYLRTSWCPAIEAKNRLNMPEEIPLDWNEYAKYFSMVEPSKNGNISGLINNGSSKQPQTAKGQ